MKTKIADAIREYIAETNPIPAHVQRAANLANLDLYFGPLHGHDVAMDDPDYAPLVEAGIISGEDCEGTFSYDKAMDVVSAYVDSLPSTLYYDEECGYIGDSEPKDEEWDTGEVDEDGEPIMEWCEPMPYYKLDSDDIKTAMFGKELANLL